MTPLEIQIKKEEIKKEMLNFVYENKQHEELGIENRFTCSILKQKLDVDFLDNALGYAIPISKLYASCFDMEYTCGAYVFFLPRFISKRKRYAIRRAALEELEKKILRGEADEAILEFIKLKHVREL